MGAQHLKYQQELKEVVQHLIEKRHDSGLIEDFTYNATGQLIQIENNWGKTISYTYDGFGNRIQKVEHTTLQPDNKNQLTNIATTDNKHNAEYDIEITKQQTKEQLQNLKQTLEDYTKVYNNVCQETGTANNEKESTLTLNYINDINAAHTEVLQVQSTNYQPLNPYTYGVQRITNEKANDTQTYYQYDAKGNVIGQQTKNDSTLRFKISYNDYGKPNRDLNNKYGYNGEVHDYNGTQYLRARYYNTNTGRFDQRDSYMGEYNNPISQNRYTYVWNSPNQYMDRNGNWPSSKSGGIVGGIAGIISGSTTPKVSAGVKVSISTLKETTRLGTVKGSSQAPKRTSLAGGIAESVKEEVKKINEKVEIEKYLQNKNLKLPDLSNLSLETQIAYLREIKRICDEQLLQLDRWDPIGTQAYIDGLKPNKNGPITAEQVFKENLPEIIAGTIIGVGLIGYLLATGGAGLPTVVAIGGKAVSAKTIVGIGATISGGTIISGGGIIHYANKAYEKGEIIEKDKNTLINGATTGIVFAIGGLITAGIYYFVNNGKVSGSGGSGENTDKGTGGGNAGANVGKNATNHTIKEHSPSKYAEQLKYKPESAALKELEYKSFFNKDWSSSKIESAITQGYQEAISKGITNGQYTSM